VVEVLVFLLLNLLMRLLERLSLGALDLFRELADQLLVQVILGFGFDDALGGYELSRFGRSCA
jgi:hypothetical protein